MGMLGPIMPLISMGAKLMGGGGAAAAAPGMPGGQGPFDAIVSGQPNPADAPPPPPQQNPHFKEDRGLFGPAKALTPPLPSPKSNSLFDEMLPNGGPGLPSRNPAFHGDKPTPEEMAQGIDGAEYGQFLDAQAAADEEAAAKKPGAPAAPINSTDTRSNDQRFRDAGYTSDSGVGQPLPKSNPLKPLPPVAGGLFNTQPTSATTPKPVDPVAAATPKLDRGLFDQPNKQKVLPQTAGATDDEEDAENGYQSGMGLFGPTVGGTLGDFQDALGDSPTNPMFQMGMGLLASGHDGTNPWLAMQRGLQAIPGHQIAAQNADLGVNADRRAEKDQARQDQELALKRQQDAAFAELLKKYAAITGTQEPGSNIARGSAKVIR